MLIQESNGILNRREFVELAVERNHEYSCSDASEPLVQCREEQIDLLLVGGDEVLLNSFHRFDWGTLNCFGALTEQFVSRGFVKLNVNGFTPKSGDQG